MMQQEHEHIWQCPAPIFVPLPPEGYVVLMPMFCACGETQLKDAGPEIPHRRRRIHAVRELPQ